MAFEQWRAELGMLLEQTRQVPEDRHELFEQIRQKFGQMRAEGLPIPQDLAELEAELEAEFAAETPVPPQV